MTKEDKQEHLRSGMGQTGPWQNDREVRLASRYHSGRFCSAALCQRTSACTGLRAPRQTLKLRKTGVATVDESRICSEALTNVASGDKGEGEDDGPVRSHTIRRY